MSDTFDSYRAHFVRRCIQIASTLILINTASGQVTCNVLASTATVDPTYNALAIQNGPGTDYEASGHPGWTGSDGASSVLLPNGISAFFFDDSFVGQSPAIANDGTVTTNSNGLRTRSTSVFHAHNVIAMFNPSTDNINTLVGAKNSNGFATSYLVPSNTNDKYWPNDATVLQIDSSGTQAVWASLGEFNGPTYVGGAIAELNYPGLSINTIAPFTNTMLTLPNGNSIRWGTSFLLTGGYGNYTLYIYGSSESQPYIASVAISSSSTVSDASNMANWLFYSSTYGWVSEATIQNNPNEAPTPIIGAAGDPKNSGDTIVPASSVRPLSTSKDGGTQTSYVVVGQRSPGSGTSCTAGGPEIVLYTACSPQGPFSAKTVVYTPPEAGMTTVSGMTGSQQLAGSLCTYFPSMHPELDSNHNLVISYDVNSTDSADLIFADAYRPRFIDVVINGLLTNPQ